MKLVILCGGLGTRFSEETKNKPKPMINIGKFPILFHIMKIYENHGITDFVLAVGYKANIIKSYFKSKKLEKVNRAYNRYIGKKNSKLNWNIEFCFSGKKTMTGGRLLRVKNMLRNEKIFLLTYGDGLSNVNISKLIRLHKRNEKIGTVTAVIPSPRFGAIKLGGNLVKNFSEKPQSGEGWINGGFFVFNSKVFKFLKNDKTILEQKPLETLSRKKQLTAFKHKKFWQCMDTRRDQELLEKLWKKKRILWLKK